MAELEKVERDWVFKAFRMHDRIEAVGLEGLGDRPVSFTSDEPVLAMVAADFAALNAAGLARAGRLAVMTSDRSDAELDAALDDALDALEHNPLPDTEWGAVRQVLGDDLLSELTGASLVSLRRYAAGSRVTPDEVAARLHFVALVGADLAGSYNELGIRRWWKRPRTQLDGRSPREALGADWDPDTSNAAATVRDLAAALVGAGAAS